MAKTVTGECIKITANTDTHDAMVEITRIEWANPGGTVGDECIITDYNGEPIAHLVAPVIEHAEQRVINSRYNGIKVPTLDGGTVYIHLEGN